MASDKGKFSGRGESSACAEAAAISSATKDGGGEEFQSLRPLHGFLQRQRQLSCTTKQKSDVLPVDHKDSDAAGTLEPAIITSSNLPEWAQPLEPVRKLPTNVGARIRNCVYSSLEKSPPEWAKEILEYSISKEVYKGNASGPTKIRNREFAMQSRERKKMYVKELEMKSKYLESECRRLDNALRCRMAENFALHQLLQKDCASAAKQESAVLFMGNTLGDPDCCFRFCFLLYTTLFEVGT
ncbi:uncharacterized protein A4U43_C05F17050 [Asparagus officinalis]|uniref:BZIP domain-containing protein n=1 Tax=Asparagus officinalis TaxID=4686 RepID=A0A5P1ESV7_ASPOF|nr:uncharacterized protein A4U43_C10F11560 [Asparagus officinalis]ONK68884.1 uncharacterized protein A4U43_C05F17050 [Asparagus officinalis]